MDKSLKQSIVCVCVWNIIARSTEHRKVYCIFGLGGFAQQLALWQAGTLPLHGLAMLTYSFLSTVTRAQFANTRPPSVFWSAY
eukprot:3249508-Amphidinium_carterae.1